MSTTLKDLNRKNEAAELTNRDRLIIGLLVASVAAGLIAMVVISVSTFDHARPALNDGTERDSDPSVVAQQNVSSAAKHSSTTVDRSEATNDQTESKAVPIATVGCTKWSLESSYASAATGTSAIIPDRCGSSVWYFMSSSTTTQIGTYALLPSFVPPTNDCAGLEGWAYNSGPVYAPHVFFNTSGGTINCNEFDIQNGWSDVHPSNTQAAVIGWKSPVTSKVNVSMNISDLDSNCGEGVQYWVSRNSTLLGSGTVSNSTSASYSGTLSVKNGEYVYVVIGPNSDWSCDSTRVQFNVTKLISPTPITAVYAF